MPAALRLEALSTMRYMSTPSRPRAESISWTSVREMGERLQKTILLYVSPAEARLWRGARIDHDSIAGVRGDEVLDGTADLSLTLAPDLSAEDPIVRFLAGLSRLDGVDLIAPRSTAEDLGGSPRVASWTIEGRNGHVVAVCRKGSTVREVGLRFASNFAHGDVSRVYGPLLHRDDDVMPHWRAFQLYRARGSAGRLFVTRRQGLIDARSSDAFPRDSGQSTPEEAMHIATLTLRRRGPHVIEADANTGYIGQYDAFDWTSAVARALLPSYLTYHAHIASEAEAGGSMLALDHCEGVFKWVRLLVLALDRLAELHLREGSVGSNNWIMLSQSEGVASAVQSAAGALEALAGLIAQRAGAVVTAGDRKQVSYPSLINQRKPWTQRLGQYAPAAALAGTGATGLLELAASMREQGFHYHPLTITDLAVGKTIQVQTGQGIPEARFIPELSLAAVQPMSGAPDAAWATHGTDGIILQGDDPPFLLPWQYVRAVTRELTACVNRVLVELGAIEGIATSTPNERGAQLERVLRVSVGL